MTVNTAVSFHPGAASANPITAHIANIIIMRITAFSFSLLFCCASSSIRLLNFSNCSLARPKQKSNFLDNSVGELLFIRL